MRTLKFIVEGQHLRSDPSCDFSGIVRGSKGYLQAEFSFDKEWDGFIKVAEFGKYMADKLIPVPIVAGKCMVPDITGGMSFRISVVGKHGDIRLTTDKVEVRQK